MPSSRPNSRAMTAGAQPRQTLLATFDGASRAVSLRSRGRRRPRAHRHRVQRRGVHAGECDATTLDRDEHDLDEAAHRWQLHSAVGDQYSDARHVDTVDPATAALTPGPKDAVKRTDRAAVALARRAPGVVRRATPSHRRQAPP